MILWMDYGTRYIWLAKKNNDFIMPIWYINNDGGLIFNLANMVEKHKISSIVIWRPKRQKDMQERIDRFIKEFKIVYPDFKIQKVDEDYTSVEASATTWTFSKDKWREDTIAAMKILERLWK